MKPYFQPFVQPSPSARNYISPDPYEPRPRLSRGSINFVEEFRPRCGSAKFPKFSPPKIFQKFPPGSYSFNAVHFSPFFIFILFYFILLLFLLGQSFWTLVIYGSTMIVATFIWKCASARGKGDGVWREKFEEEESGRNFCRMRIRRVGEKGIYRPVN